MMVLQGGHYMVFIYALLIGSVGDMAGCLVAWLDGWLLGWLRGLLL